MGVPGTTLLRLPRQLRAARWAPYELVDVLRAVSRHSIASVIGRTWWVSDVEPVQFSGADDPEWFLPGCPWIGEPPHALVSGERLMERAAVTHQFHQGLFL